MPNITKKVKSFGINAQIIESQTQVIHENIKNARLEMLDKPSPRFFECSASRWKEHLGPNDDYSMNYRSLKEVKKWITKDEVVRVGNKLSPSKKKGIEDDINNKIKKAFSFAKNSPMPDREDLFSNVFCGNKV